MNKEKEFNDILDACLERLARGDTLEQCLASYPNQATQLEPLLQTASMARAAVAITPRSEFKTRSMYQLSEALRQTKPGVASSFLSFVPRWAVAVSAFLVFVMVGSGTVVVAGNSMPDSFLYPVKIATERVQLAFTTSDLSKTELYVKLADRRVTEIINMAAEDKPDKIAGTAQRLDELLVSIAGVTMTPQPASMKVAPDETPEMVPAPMLGLEPETVLAPEPAPAPVPRPEGAPELETTPLPESPAVDRTGGDIPQVPPEQARLIELLRRYQRDHPEKLRAVLENAPPSLRALLQRIIDHSQASYQQALRAWETSGN